MEGLKIQWLHEKPPIAERNPNLFYYDIRNSEVDNGYQIERGVLVNNIGSLVANKHQFLLLRLYAKSGFTSHWHSKPRDNTARRQEG